MNYPITIQKLLLPDGYFELYVPDEQAIPRHSAIKSDKAGHNYWARLWPSAMALASFLQNNKALIKNKMVAELGAGLGLPAMVAATVAKNVWCSDIIPEAMLTASKSAEVNQLANIQFEACSWNLLPADFEAEVVLLSDINYEPLVFNELEKMLTGLLQKGSLIVLASPQRLMAKLFLEKLSCFITGQSEEMVYENGQQHFISIFILELSG